MTSEDRIDRLEQRVDKIEDDVWSKLESIDEKLNKISLTLAAKKECPAPGACIALQDRVHRLEGVHDALAKSVTDLIRWRAWLTGINLVISTASLAALTILGNYILKHL